MSGFAVFALKDPSLLALDQRCQDDSENLIPVFGITQIPCDSRLREILDPVNPADLPPAFNQVLTQLQRGKALEQMRSLGQYYLISADGTGFYLAHVWAILAIRR